MKVVTLSKKEFADIVSDRVYILAFFVQLIIVTGIIYTALLYTFVATPAASPASSVFVQVEKPIIGVVGERCELTKNLEKELRVSYETGNPEEILRRTNLVAVLIIPKDFEKNIKSGANVDLKLVLDNTNILSGYADVAISEVVSEYSREVKRERLSMRFEDPDAILAPIKVEEASVKTQARELPTDSPEFIEIMYGLLIPFILLIPTFLSANMTTDSIVGEKEKRTYETLISLPITKKEIILGKSLPILLITLAQTFLWVLLLEVKGIVIYNIALLLLTVLLLDLAFIGFGIVISAISENLKESNLSVTIFLIVVSLSFFAPISIKKELYNISPITLISKLSSNPSVSSHDILLPFTLLLISGIIVIYGGERLLEWKEDLRL